MKTKPAIFVWSLIVAIVFTTLAAVLSGVPGLSWIGMIFLPGMALAALVFPEGIHSDHGNAFLLLMGLINSVLLSLLFAGLGMLWVRRQEAKRTENR